MVIFWEQWADDTMVVLVRAGRMSIRNIARMAMVLLLRFTTFACVFL